MNRLICHILHILFGVGSRNARPGHSIRAPDLSLELMRAIVRVAEVLRSKVLLWKPNEHC